MARLRLIALGFVLLAACANSGRSKKDKADEAAEEEAIEQAESGGAAGATPGRGESAPSVSYEATAEGNWLKGEEAFGEEEYLAAQRYYSYLKTKFPYSQYTLSAELRIADCQFARTRFVESIDAYQNFVRMHPTHEKVAYATFRIGMAYFQQIPSNFFLLPPAEEKDQAAVRDAERALRQYVDRFPDDENQKEAKEVLADVRRRLMAHEQYVADFYGKQEKDRARVGRLEVIRREYADVGLSDELLFEIAKLWARAGEPEKVKSAVDELAAKFPGSDRLGQARRLVVAQPAAEKPKDKTGPAPAPPAPDLEPESGS